MRYLLASAVKDLRRYSRDPLGMLLALAIPLVIGTLITLAMGGAGGPQPTAHLLLVDEDDSFLSNLLQNALDAAGEVVDVETVDREEGERRIHDGDGSGLLVIPAGFGDAFLREEECELLLLTNPSQRILPGILEEGVSILVDGAFYVHRILGDELRTIVDTADGGNAFADADIASLSISFNQVVQRLEEYLFPPVIDLEVAIDRKEEEEEPARKVTLGLLLLPGILMMALLFTAQGLSEDIWTEREKGTLARAVAGPGHLAGFLAGKVLAGGFTITLTMLAGVLLGTLAFDLSFALLPLAVLWAVWIGLLILLIMNLVQLYMSSRRAASVVLGSLVFPLMMLGGSLIPIEAFPSWMAKIGAATPNGWATEHLKDIFLERHEPAALLQAFGLSVAVAVVILFLTARRVRSLGGAR